MPDGSRKRRHSSNPARSRWYAQHRSVRFRRRFGLEQKTAAKAESVVAEVARSLARVIRQATATEVLLAGAA